MVVPERTHIVLSACAIHRNPKYWPSGSMNSTGDADGNDLDSFKPERWLKIDANAEASSTKDVKSAHAANENDNFGGPQGHDTSASLLRPPRGSYIPFSDGARACLGRRFASVETIAVIAVLLRDFTVELAVDSFASDAEIENLPRAGPERQAIWQKAADRAYHSLKYDMLSMITIQLRKGAVPLRVVKKGEERFP